MYVLRYSILFTLWRSKRQLLVGDVEVNSETERFIVIVEKRHQNHKCQLLLIGFLIKPIKYLICHDVAVIVAKVRLLCDFAMATRVISKNDFL